jgi:hypothetical protein
MTQFRIVLQLKNDLNNSSKVNLRDRRMEKADSIALVSLYRHPHSCQVLQKKTRHSQMKAAVQITALHVTLHRIKRNPGVLVAHSFAASIRHSAESGVAIISDCSSPCFGSFPRICDRRGRTLPSHPVFRNFPRKHRKFWRRHHRHDCSALNRSA